MLCGSFRPLLPILADQFNMGEVGFGLLSSAPAVGSLIGAATVMYLGDFPYKGRLIVGGILAYAVALIGLGLAPWFWLAFIAAAALGLTDALQAQTRSALIQLMTPDDLRGRVSAFQHMLQAGGPAFGQGLMGAAANAVTSPVALVAGGITCAAITLCILAVRTDIRARELDGSTDPFPSTTQGVKIA
jgi:MFS family permease